MWEAKERNVALTGPYLARQQPSACGHYYPDVLRLRDEKRPDGKLVRILDCLYCGRFESPLEGRTLARPLLRKLNKKGFDLGTPEEELSEVRKKAFEELSSGDNDG